MRGFFCFLAIAFAVVACSQENASTTTNDDGEGPTNATSSNCVAPKSSCGSSCVDVSSDDANCGTCGNACGSEATCAKSACACADTTKSFCGGGCIDTKSDPKNCGGCGVVCPNANCTNGECDKVAFVTAQLYATSIAGNKGPLVAGDALCQTEASAAKFSGTFMAWLGNMSDGPSTRFKQAAVPYVLPDGKTIVANDWTELTSGSLSHAIDQDSAGNTLDSSDDTRRVMTNVSASGDPGAPPLDCNEWTQTSGSVQTGDPTLTSSEWTDLTTAPSTWDCSLTYRLYCFAQ